MTQREKLASGCLYTDMDEGMAEERLRGKELVYDFNHTRPSERTKREALIRQLMGRVGKNFGLSRRCMLPMVARSLLGKTFTPTLIWLWWTTVRC